MVVTVGMSRLLTILKVRLFGTGQADVQPTIKKYQVFLSPKIPSQRVFTRVWKPVSNKTKILQTGIRIVLERHRVTICYTQQRKWARILSQRQSQDSAGVYNLFHFLASTSESEFFHFSPFWRPTTICYTGSNTKA